MAKYRYRRKDFPCILCEEPTRDWDHVCNQCRHGRRVGVGVAKQEGAQEGEREYYAIRWYVDVHDYGGNEEPFALEESEGEMMIDLLQALGQSADLGRNARRASKRTLANRKSDTGSGYHYLFLTESQADAAEGIVNFCRRLWRTAYLSGYQDGSRILGRIAGGDLTLEQLHGHETKRAKNMQGPEP